MFRTQPLMSLCVSFYPYCVSLWVVVSLQSLVPSFFGGFARFTVFPAVTLQQVRLCASVCYRTIPVTLVLKDPQYLDEDLGALELAVTLTPKDSPLEERRDSTVSAPTSWCCSDVSRLEARRPGRMCERCVSCGRLRRIAGSRMSTK